MPDCHGERSRTGTPTFPRFLDLPPSKPTRTEKGSAFTEPDFHYQRTATGKLNPIPHDYGAGRGPHAALGFALGHHLRRDAFG